MSQQLEELKLSDLTSSVDVKFLRGESTINPAYDILVVKFSGHYPDGSAGNASARFMYAMGNAALSAWDPSAVIIDLVDLHYQWGDMLEMVFSVGANRYVDAPFPMAALVGPHCSEAIRTLLHGINSKESLNSIPWVHESLDGAWTYLDTIINAD